MLRDAWYLVTYDIANPRRLKKVHKILKNYGVAAQKSVFFVRGDEGEMENFMDYVATKMILTEDDLRAYPIEDPEFVWTNGTNPLAGSIADTRQVHNKKPVNLKKKIKEYWSHIESIWKK